MLLNELVYSYYSSIFAVVLELEIEMVHAGTRKIRKNTRVETTLNSSGVLIFLPRDPLGQGRSTVSPLCALGHWMPRAMLGSHPSCSSGSWGGRGRGRGGRRVTGTVAVMGRSSGALFMAPIG